MASTLLMSSTMDKTQRYLLIALPLVFLFFVTNFPAGLIIYWVTTNLWTTGQGLVTRQLRAEGRAAREAELADAAEGGPGERRRSRASRPPKPSRRAQAQAPRRVKRKKKRARR